MVQSQDAIKKPFEPSALKVVFSSISAANPFDGLSPPASMLSKVPSRISHLLLSLSVLAKAIEECRDRIHLRQ